jgi:hypothetical protein
MLSAAYFEDFYFYGIISLIIKDLCIEPSARHFARIFGGVVYLRRQKPQQNNEAIGQSRF